MSLSQIKASSAAAAVYIRGMVLSSDSHEVPLRQAQEAGAKALTDLGSSISVAYISRLSRRVEEAEVFTRRKVGRNYQLTRGRNYTLMVDFLESHPQWGTKLEELTDLQAQAYRILTAAHLEEHDGSVRTNHERKLPRDAWAMLMKKYYDGELDMAFFPSTSSVYIKRADGRAAKIVEVVYDSDAIQEIVNA